MTLSPEQFSEFEEHCHPDVNAKKLVIVGQSMAEMFADIGRKRKKLTVRDIIDGAASWLEMHQLQKVEEINGKLDSEISEMEKAILR